MYDMERKSYIYKITNLINNKVYIGQSIDVKQRWRQHKYETKKDKPKMIINRAMKKHGIENFSFEVIASCFDMSAANDAETFIVAQENSLIPNGYNVTNGGYNSPKTKEWKQQMSLKAKERYVKGEITTLNRKGGVLPSRRGSTMSEEFKQNMSIRMKGHTYNNGRKHVNRKSPSSHYRLISKEQVQEILNNPLKLTRKQLAIKYNCSEASIKSYRRKEKE